MPAEERRRRSAYAKSKITKTPGLLSSRPPRGALTPHSLLSRAYTRNPSRCTRRTRYLRKEGRQKVSGLVRRRAFRTTRKERTTVQANAPPPVSLFKHVSKRESTISTISGCSPIGAATKCPTPGCFAAASAARCGMSSCQCLPGDRKNGLTATIVAPCSTHLANAVSMLGSAISMCASSTIGRPVCSLYIRTNSPKTSFDACRLDPWSTMTTPILTSSVPDALTHDDARARPRVRNRDRRGSMRSLAKRHGACTARVPTPCITSY